MKLLNFEPGPSRPAKRWYHCWLKHWWSKWSDPEPYEFLTGDKKTTYTQMGQVRFCLFCNQRRTRHA